jgi:hypothetical protein
VEENRKTRLLCRCDAASSPSSLGRSRGVHTIGKCDRVRGLNEDYARLRTMLSIPFRCTDVKGKVNMFLVTADLYRSTPRYSRHI